MTEAHRRTRLWRSRHRDNGVLARRRSPGLKVFNLVRRRGFDIFSIGPFVDAPDELAAGLDWKWQELTRGELGIAVTLPEWSTAAVGWLIEVAFEAALSLEPAPYSLSVRVSRTAPK